MTKIAVIGSNSFSGSHFANYVLENTDYAIIGISRSPEYNPIFLPYKKRDDYAKRFRFFQMNINHDVDKIIELFKKEDVEYVVNFAAQGMVGQSWLNPIDWFRTNVLGIVSLTNELKNHLPNLKKYVQISTPEIYGPSDNIKEDAPYNPSTPYAVSKLAGDMFIQTITKQFSFPAVFVRSTNVYGYGQQLYRIIPRSIIYMKMGKTIELHGGGEAIKSYIHIRDVCDGILKIMQKGRVGEVYHLSPEGGYSIKTIVQMICDKMGKNFEDVTKLVGERLGQDAQYIINSDKARKELGWLPKIPINQGIQECIDWVNENWDIIKKQPLEYIHKE